MCQRFWRVDGRADTAVGIRGQPSAYPSITLSFPHSIHLSILSIYRLSNSVSLAKDGEGEEWHGKGETGRYWAVFKLIIRWSRRFQHNLWLLHVVPRTFSLSLACTQSQILSQHDGVLVRYHNQIRAYCICDQLDYSLDDNRKLMSKLTTCVPKLLTLNDTTCREECR